MPSVAGGERRESEETASDPQTKQPAQSCPSGTSKQETEGQRGWGGPQQTNADPDHHLVGNAWSNTHARTHARVAILRNCTQVSLLAPIGHYRDAQGDIYRDTQQQSSTEDTVCQFTLQQKGPFCAGGQFGPEWLCSGKHTDFCTELRNGASQVTAC